jgi:hypothetical protein
MGFWSWRHGVAIAVLSIGTSYALMAAAAENLDNPTILADKPLNGASTVEGKITPRVGFPAHVYTAGKDGIVKVVIDTKNLNDRDNGGAAWRPYMRVLSQSNAERNGEAWSTNGFRNATTSPPSAQGELVFRVKKGEKFTVIATLGQHIESSQRATVDYKLTVKE